MNMTLMTWMLLKLDLRAAVNFGLAMLQRSIHI